MVKNTLFAEFVKSAPYTENGKALLLNTSTITPFAHQINVADRIVNNFPARYLLADEVGLGKTIEAGLALKEHIIQICKEILIKEEYLPFVKQYRGEKRRMLLKADQGKIKQKIPNLIMRWNKNKERFNAMIQEVEQPKEAEMKHEVIGGLVVVSKP